MKRFNSLLFILGLGLFFARADGLPSANPGFIGMSFTHATGTDFLFVYYVANKSPAAEVGIQKGDEITAIYGMPIGKMSAVELKRAMEVDVGSVVTVTLRREGAKNKDISLVLRSLLDTYMPAIQAGDHQAEVALGYQYEHGPASVVDKAKALAWYKTAAYQGDAAGERSLATLYFDGWGVPQSDHDAFAWFYAAAVQDDPRAEYYLGQLYQNGRGVAASNETAFYWYDKAAHHGIPYAEWNLGYAYEKGFGVKKDTEEALKWFQKAEVRLPNDDKLKQHIAILSMQAFVENPNSGSLDPAQIVTVFGRYLVPAFYVIMAIYIFEFIALLYFSFRDTGKSVGILVAIAWVLFYLEGQFVAVVVLLVQGTAITTSTFLIATCLFAVAPIVVSTLGPNRHRIWKTSAVSRKTLFLYGVGAYVTNGILLAVFSAAHSIVSHASLPGQPTEVLISKAKHGSVFLAVICIAVVLPLAEEILFRGYLFEALKKRFSDIFTVIVTALAFSLVHFQGLYFAPLFGFGLVQGWLRLRTGSLRLPVILHVLNNALFVAMSS